MRIESNRGISLQDRFLDWGLEKRIGDSLSKESLEYLGEVRRHLQSDGSLLVVFNHPTVLDPRFLISIVNKLRSKETPVAPAILTAAKFAEGGMKRLGRIHAAFAEKHRIELLYVVQPGVLFGLSGQELERANNINYTALKRAREILNTNGGILLVAPEGTRSKGKRIGNGIELVGRLFEKTHNKRGDRIRCLPIGIDANDFPEDLESLTFGKRLEAARWVLGSNLVLRVGTMESFIPIREEADRLKVSLTEVLMQRISSLLPEEYSFELRPASEQA